MFTGWLATMSSRLCSTKDDQHLIDRETTVTHHEIARPLG
jgi:hypothetical protein